MKGKKNDNKTLANPRLVKELEDEKFKWCIELQNNTYSETEKKSKSHNKSRNGNFVLIKILH